MILYVDTEDPHAPYDAERHARLERARQRLEVTAGETCVIRRAGQVSLGQVQQAGPTAMVLSGSTTDWAEYDFTVLDGLLEVIRTAPVPILGICAGHQLIGYAHGARWGPLGVLPDGEADPDPRFAPGQRKQRGYVPVELDITCAIFRGLARQTSFFESHYWQLEEVPVGFSVRAHTEWSAIQAIERTDRAVFGVQFHPERFDSRHSSGQRLLRNFFRLRTHQAG